MSLVGFLGLTWMLLLTGGLVLWGKSLSQKHFTREQWDVRTLELSQRPIDVYFIGKVLLFLLASLGIVGALIHYTHPWFPGPQEGAIASGLVWQGLVSYVGITLFVLVLCRSVDGGVARIFGLTKGTFPGSAKLGVAGYMMSIPVSLLIGLMYFGILYFFDVEMEQQPVLEALLAMDSSVWIAFSFFFAVIAAPAVEELLFRGLLLPFSLRTLGPWGGLLLSSLLFAFIHGHLLTLFPLFLISVGFSLSYIWTGSIWVPVVMHASFNFMNLATGFIQSSGGV